MGRILDLEACPRLLCDVFLQKNQAKTKNSELPFPSLPSIYNIPSILSFPALRKQDAECSLENAVFVFSLFNSGL
jgi:hypothetical protein